MNFITWAFLCAAAALSAAPQKDAVTSLVQRATDEQNVPSISVAVACGGRIFHATAAGYADLEGGTKAAPTTLYRIASLSKPVTATLALHLAEQKRVDLDAPIGKYVTEWPTATAQPTLRQLLAHRGGIRDYRSANEMFATVHYDNLSAALAGSVLQDPLLFAPGSSMKYSTYGYTVAGAVLEKATGQTFELLVQSVQPSLMIDNYFRLTPDRARGYGLYRGKLSNAPAFDSSLKYPGGGLLASATDYLNFLLALNANKLLPQDRVAEMWTPMSKSPDGRSGYGLGWMTGSRAGHDYVQHGGNQVGAQAGMRLYPKLGFAWVALSNGEHADLRKLGDAIEAIFLPASANCPTTP
ncbi:MAG TPA: serine hydrolase domain-containing protein [Bryobacteraceae bacterium]|nr:serine hydrolase domain-containing protein [Bryobacteraceae bacterium]